MDILPRQREARNKYLNYIPCTWTIVNNHRGLFVPASILWDMMVLTKCNFRVDEYMETAVAKLDVEGLEQNKNTIRMLSIGTNVEKPQRRKRRREESIERANNGWNRSSKENGTKESDESDSFKHVVGQYARVMLGYP